jgi:hypothetical protein
MYPSINSVIPQSRRGRSTPVGRRVRWEGPSKLNSVIRVRHRRSAYRLSLKQWGRQRPPVVANRGARCIVDLRRKRRDQSSPLHLISFHRRIAPSPLLYLLGRTTLRDQRSWVVQSVKWVCEILYKSVTNPHTYMVAIFPATP